MAKNDTKTITIRISEENYKHIEVQSMQLHMSKNGYIEYIIDEDRAKYAAVYSNFKDENGVTLYEYMYGENHLAKRSGSFTEGRV